jgi:hypothetical protein
MAIVRGLAVTPDAGMDKCYAVELALDDTEYENALDVRVVFVCEAKPAVYEYLGSGVCQIHHLQLKERGQSIN